MFTSVAMSTSTKLSSDVENTIGPEDVATTALEKVRTRFDKIDKATQHEGRCDRQ